jgi:hypothetical protein
MEASPRDFATTLTCLAATSDGVAVAQVGDGLAVFEGTGGSLSVAIRPQRGEFANEVNLLTSPGAVETLDVAVMSGDIKSIVVSTDGLLRLALKLPDYEPHQPFFRPLLTFASETVDETEATESLRAFLESERVCQRTDDDKTLVLAVRAGMSPSDHPTEALS